MKVFKIMSKIYITYNIWINKYNSLFKLIITKVNKILNILKYNKKDLFLMNNYITLEICFINKNYIKILTYKMK
jgi:hypothetical protein